MPVKPSAQPTLVRTQHLPPRKIPGHGRCAEFVGLSKASGVPNRPLSPAPGRAVSIGASDLQLRRAASDRVATQRVRHGRWRTLRGTDFGDELGGRRLPGALFGYGQGDAGGWGKGHSDRSKSCRGTGSAATPAGRQRPGTDTHAAARDDRPAPGTGGQPGNGPPRTETSSSQLARSSRQAHRITGFPARPPGARSLPGTPSDPAPATGPCTRPGRVNPPPVEEPVSPGDYGCWLPPPSRPGGRRHWVVRAA